MWKRQRLIELGFGVPDSLRFVPVDFEAGDDWRDGLVAAGFDTRKPAIVVSTGVGMYLTKEASATMLRQVATLAPGSTLAMTFLLPLHLAEPEVRPGLEMAEKGARQRHAFSELLHAAGDAGAGASSGFCRRATCVGGRSDAALFRLQNGWFAATGECGRVAGREYVVVLRGEAESPHGDDDLCNGM